MAESIHLEWIEPVNSRACFLALLHARLPCKLHSAALSSSSPPPGFCPPLPPPRSNLASDDGLQQLQFILNGMFGRACKNLGNPEATAMLVKEVGDVRDTLISKLAGEPRLP